jgi:hypothetical protein
VAIVGEMAIRMSFASKGGERREWRSSGLTRTSTNLPMVYLSPVCRCPRPRCDARACRATLASAPTPHCPRPLADRGRAFPTHPRPEAPWSPPGSCVADCPRRTGRAHATDHRSVCGVPPYARRSRPPYHNRIFAVMPSSSPANSPLFKVVFHPRTRHHCHSHRHDCRLSELPFFPSVSSPADTPNTSSSSHVRRSLCLWASRKPPSPATPPTAATAAGPRRALTPAIYPPQLRPPMVPR